MMSNLLISSDVLSVSLPTAAVLLCCVSTCISHRVWCYCDSCWTIPYKAKLLRGKTLTVFAVVYSTVNVFS